MQPYKIEFAEGKPYKIEFREKVDLELTDVNEDSVLITGLAVSNKVNTKYMRFTENALDVATKKENWIGAKALVDHEYDSFRIVGQVKNFDRVPEGVAFGIDINPHHPSKIHIAVKRGDVDAVSVGGYANSITCSICGEEAVECHHRLGSKYDGKIAVGLINDFHLKELSLTGFPADTNAKITGFYGLAQSINDLKRELEFGPSYAERKNLPDSSFAMPEQRKLPYKDKNGKVNCSWVRDALRLANKVKGGAPSSAISKLRSAAKKCGIETEQNDIDDEESSEKFINIDNKDKSDLKMSAENIKPNAVKNEQQKDFEKELKVLQSALEKYSKENEELKKIAEEQGKFIEQKKAEEREQKIVKIMQISDMKRETLEQFSDEELDSSLVVLSGVKVPKEDVKIVPTSQTIVGKPIIEQSRKEKSKAVLRELFGFPEPSETAVKKVQQMMRKPVYNINEILIGDKGE